MAGKTSGEYLKDLIRQKTHDNLKKKSKSKPGKKYPKDHQEVWDKIRPGTSNLSKVYGYLCSNRKISKEVVPESVSEK